MENAGPYTEALKARLPSALSSRLDAIVRRSAEDAQTIEDMLAFLEADASPSQPTGSKRPRTTEEQEDTTSKRARHSPTPLPTAPPAASADPARCTLHALSATAPVRKKVDLTIRAHSIQLTVPEPANGSTTLAGVSPNAKVEATLPLASLARAFVLPTRGKTKPHWTVVLLSSDAPAPKGSKESAPEAQQQLIFGLDALVGAAELRVSRYDSDGRPTASAIPKGEPTLDVLREFLSHLPAHAQPVLQPDASVLRGPGAGGGGGTKSRGGGGANGAPAAAKAVVLPGQEATQAGVEAYRGAKAGTLWFFPQGLLWGESRPCEFWSLADVLDVRSLSATGRTCSVFVRRRAVPTEGAGSGDEDEEQDANAIETEFGMIDGKEQDAILGWVRKFESRFGKAEVPGEVKVDRKGKGKAIEDPLVASAPAVPTGPVTANSGLWADDEEDDEDFAGSESSSSGSGSEEDSEEEGSDEEEEAEASGGEEGEENAEQELDPAHHPLLRPGAMPKRVSKAVIDAVAGMVQDDMRGAEVDELEEDELNE
jgi:hypothetical protein